MTSPTNTLPGRTRAVSWSFARALAWLGIALLLLGAWLALPTSTGTRSPLDIVLVDVSKSVVGPRGAAWTRFVRDTIDGVALKAAVRHADVCVVAFGSEVRTLAGPASAEELHARVAADPRTSAGFEILEHDAQDGADATKLAAALELAVSLAADRDATRVVLLGDGTYTGRDPEALEQALDRAGASIETPDIPPPDRTNIALGPLTVPRAIERDAPLIVSLEALLEPGLDESGGGSHRSTRVDILRRDAKGESTTRIDLPELGGTGQPAIVPLHADLGPAIAGTIEIEARVRRFASAGEPATDAIPEDDVSRARVRCGGTLVVGVADASLSGAPILALLRPLGAAPSAGMQVVPIASGALGDALAVADVIVTADDPLTADEERLLASFVVHGGGWLDVAGWNWIAQRARADGPLAAIAPLEPAHADLGPRDVILLVDASGSMAGAPFESVRAAIGPVMDAALPQDDVDVRFFADDVSVPLSIDAAQRADPAARRAFQTRVTHAREPQGSTQLWRALDRIAVEKAASTRDTLVVLLSDGRDPDRSDSAVRGAALRARLGSAHVRLAVLAAGDDPDRELLASLLLPEEAIEDAGDLARPDASVRLARAFAREIERDAVRAGPIEVVAVAHENGPAAEIARASPALAPIARAVRAELGRSSPGSPGSQDEVFWSAPDGAPLGAIARVGSGLAASLAFVPASDWAPQWNDAVALAPLVRLLGREHALRSEGPRLVEDDGRLCLENAPPDLPAPAHAHVADGTGASAEMLFAETGASGDPLRERCAQMPTDLDRVSGSWTVTFELGTSQAASSGTSPLVLALATPRAPEFTLPKHRHHLRTDPGAARAPVSVPTPHPLHPWAIGAGMALLFAAALLGAFSRRRVLPRAARQAFPPVRR